MDQDERNVHNAIYDINQRLQNMSNSIVDLAIKHDRLLSKLESRIKELDIAFENFKENIEKVCHSNVQDVGKAITEVNVLRREVESQFSKIPNTYVDILSYDDDQLHIMEFIGDLRRDIKQKQDVFNEINRSLHNHVSEEVTKVKDDITPLIPKIDPVKEEVEKQLIAFRVEMKGLNKELILLKKSKAYDEKKFENIYTLIERLKEKE